LPPPPGYAYVAESKLAKGIVMIVCSAIGLLRPLAGLKEITVAAKKDKVKGKGCDELHTVKCCIVLCE